MCSADMIRDFVLLAGESSLDDISFSSHGMTNPFPSSPKNLGIGTSSRGVPISGRGDIEPRDGQVNPAS